MILFQENKKRLNCRSSKSYDVDRKLQELFHILRIYRKPYLGDLKNILSLVGNYFKRNARYPFRDATPKNYILKGIHRKNILSTPVKHLKNKIYWIDLRTINDLTLREDDYISILYHYMIPEKIRLKILKRYKINPESKDFIVSGFVRVGRFWLRRFYYKKYYPELFQKRYGREKLDFYDKQMDYFSNKILSLKL